MVCFVLPSCCTTAGSDPIALLLPNTFVYCMGTIRTISRYCCILLYVVPAPHTFLHSDDLLNTNYDRSSIGEERPMLIPSVLYHQLIFYIVIRLG